MAEKKITVKELTRESGLGANTVYRIIRRERKPNTVTLGKIAGALHVSPNELLQDDKGE